MILLNKFINKYNNGRQRDYILLFKNKIITIMTPEDNKWSTFTVDIKSHLVYYWENKNPVWGKRSICINVLSKHFYTKPRLFIVRRDNRNFNGLRWVPYGYESISISHLINTCVNKLAIKFLAKIMHDYNLETRNKIRKMLF